MTVDDDVQGPARRASISPETEWRVWRYAGAYLMAWPHLLVSWYDWYPGVEPHFVLHQGAAATGVLHFDSDEDLTWVTPSGEERILNWSDVHEMGFWVPSAGFDAKAAWGEPDWDHHRPDSGRLLAYSLIRALLSIDRETHAFRVRPAKILAPEGEPSVHRLLAEFPSLTSTVSWYADLIRVEYKRRSREGAVAYWHEPLWLVTWYGVPVVVVDEAGYAHGRGGAFEIAALVEEQGDMDTAAAHLLESGSEAHE